MISAERRSGGGDVILPMQLVCRLASDSDSEWWRGMACRDLPTFICQISSLILTQRQMEEQFSQLPLLIS